MTFYTGRLGRGREETVGADTTIDLMAPSSSLAGCRLDNGDLLSNAVSAAVCLSRVTSTAALRVTTAAKTNRGLDAARVDTPSKALT